MRAAWYERQGDPQDVLQVGERDRPEPRAGEVRVRIHASGVNPSDTYGRSGRQAPMAFPWVIPHQDGAGVIDAVGGGVPTDRVGERVWVYEATFNRQGGTAAEYCVVPANRAVRLPHSVDFDSGACLGIPAMTAHRAVFADGPVHGQTILVTGGAGGVGSTAIQLAVWGGATVFATVSSEEKARVARDRGASQVLNYREQDVAAEVQKFTSNAGVERVVDVDFGGNLATSTACLKPNGVIASYASRGAEKPEVPFRQLMVKNITVHAILVYTMAESAKQAAMSEITRALEAGALHPLITSRLSLDDIARAHAHVERVSSIGNTVLQVS
ncbi:MAG: NADPH:quinone reductase [Chloroflexi bacterium]|nr:NADPH:quinone reductase [Chloroflexota bacterium]